MKRKIAIMVMLSAMLMTAGCGKQESNDINGSDSYGDNVSSTMSDTVTANTADLSDDEAGGEQSTEEESGAYNGINELASSVSFPVSGTGAYDLGETPKDWIEAAFESHEITAGLGGDNEKKPVSDLETLLKMSVDYNSNFEIHLNDEDDVVITCTDFFNPYTADKPCTVEDCLNRGWWKADNMISFAGKDYLDNPVRVDDLLDLFGDPTDVYMTDEETYKETTFDSLDEFKAKAGEMMKKTGSAEYDLVWDDGVKYMISGVSESMHDNYVLSPNLYGKDQFMYNVFGEEPDLESETDAGTGKTENSADDKTVAAKESIDQIVFPENNGRFTTVTVKNDYRNNYFTIELPSDYTFNTAWGSPYEGYTVEQYADEQHTDKTVWLDSGAAYDNDFMASYIGTENSMSGLTNTESLAKKNPDGVWVEGNGLKAYVYEDSHIFVSIESEESVNLLVSFYGDTNKYSLEEYGKYILNLVHLIK